MSFMLVSMERKRSISTLFIGVRLSPLITVTVGKFGKIFDVDKMNEAAQYFVGTHNYTAFAGSHSQLENENPNKTILSSEVSQYEENCWVFTVRGTGFMYKMVRSMVGALVDVGRGRLQPEAIAEFLAAQKRTNKIVTAPAQGLFFLNQIKY